MKKNTSYLNFLFIVLLLFLFPIENSHAQSTKEIDSLKLILSNKIPDSIKVNTLNQLAATFFPKQLDSTKFYANELMAFSENTNNTLGKAKAFKLMGNVHIVRKEYEESTRNYKKAVTTVKNTDASVNTKTSMTINLMISHVYSEKYQEALETGLPLLKYLNQNQLNSINKELIFRYLGNSYLGLGDKKQAIAYFKKNIKVYSDPNRRVQTHISNAKRLYESNDYTSTLEFLLPVLDLIEEENISPLVQSKAYNFLGSLYNDLQEYEKAINYSKKTQVLAVENKLYSLQVSNLNRMGFFYRKVKKYEKAKKVSLEALAIIEQNNINIYKSQTLKGLGYSYSYLNDYENAITYFLKATEIIKKEGNIYDIANSYCSLGEVYLKSKEFDKGKAALEKSKKLFTQLSKSKKETNLKLMVYKSLSAIDSAQGNAIGNLLNYKQYIKLRDSLSNNDQKQKIADLAIAYETEKKDKEIIQLTADNKFQKLQATQQRNLKTGLLLGSVLLFLLLTVSYNRYRIKKRTVITIEKQKLAIESKNQENELLIKEIHHRVKNNLQIILSLLSAQNQTAKGNKKATEVIIESQNKIKSMALIHENLYNSNSLIKVPTATYFQDLIYHIKSSYCDDDKQITFKTNIDDSKIRMTLAVPLGLIVNELITNAYKYAFEDAKGGNIITINFKKTPEKDIYRLEVFDNGKGLPDCFDIDTSKTFGLQMIKGLVNQFDGKVEFHKEKGAGFDIYIKDVAIDEDNQAA